MSFDVGHFTRKLRAAKASMRDAAMLGLADGAQYILSVSTDLVPLDTGVLQASGKVTTDPAQLRAAISYHTEYAVRQHEELSYRHAAGRQAKYLEKPLYSSRAQLLVLMQRRLQRGI